jgi:maltooligosyltrehalose trehalohydrolase
MAEPKRRLPVGAEVVAGGVHFRVWAPRRRRVEVALVERRSGGDEETQFAPLAEDGDGYFSGIVREAHDGSLYRYRLDGGSSFPDPAARSQPEGPHGPSQVVDPARYAWRDEGWKGISRRGQVLYEMHVGTFTHEGTFAAAEHELEDLARLGITVVEVMPVAEFSGRFGWGYDGVDLFAPKHLYGTPDDFRRFVDTAHGLGLGVILDVVYNHVGPDGNYLGEYSESYFSEKHKTDWGPAINFDGENSGPVRDFFVSNAGYWIDEFHLDGLRLDATQNIHDDSREHVLAVIARRVREAAGGRATFLAAENESQQAQLARAPEEGGYGLDALWNDDLHHTALVALTGRAEAYYRDYKGTPQELVSAVKHGYLYQGQWYTWQKQRRGSSTRGLPPEAFVAYLENHDQVANSGRGLRVHQLTSPGRYRAMTAYLLLGPATPLLFQGQEFQTASPFLFFADHEAKLAAKVVEGRAEFLAQFPSLARPEWKEALPKPHSPDTFHRCRLDPAERESHAEARALHADLLRLRREDPIFREQGRHGIDGAVLAQSAFALRWFGADGDDRLLLVNLGPDLRLEPVPEPLLAPPPDKRWRIVWSSDDLRYGGYGTPPLHPDEVWQLPGEAAIALRPEPRPEDPQT